MKESKKILIGLAVIGAMCICVAGITFFAFREFGKRVENMAEESNSPATIAEAQENIAKFTTPKGYSASAMDLFTYEIVTLTPDLSEIGGNGPMIVIMQYKGLLPGNNAQMEQQLRQAVQQQGGGAGSSMQIVDTFETTIREETVTVTVSESSYQSYTTRQWMTIFKGNNGPTILMIQGPSDEWDDQLVEDFIASIQ